MSFQAHLVNIETKTGLTPGQFLVSAHQRGYDEPGVKAGIGAGWADRLAEVQTGRRRRSRPLPCAP